jgi:hypothetical protein
MANARLYAGDFFAGLSPGVRCSVRAIEENIPAIASNRHRFLADEKKITGAPGATPV